MIITLILLLFGLFAIGGLLYLFIGMGVGLGKAIMRKRKGESFEQQSLRTATENAYKIAEKKAAKARRRGYSPNVEVQVKVNVATAKEETPQEREAREKAEARKRYLESLVDK